MKATITVEYRPLEPHQRTGGPDLPWTGDTLLSARLDGSDRPDRTGICRGATFVDALNMCVAGLVGHYRDEEPVDALKDMTSDQWDAMTETDRESMRDLTGLTPQLVGLEGWRVEVETTYGETRRFIVGKSTGWKPCHLEIHNRRSTGGGSAERTYQSVRKLYNARGGQ